MYVQDSAQRIDFAFFTLYCICHCLLRVRISSIQAVEKHGGVGSAIVAKKDMVNWELMVV